MHAVAVELDLVQPLRPVRRRVHEPGQLRPDPLRQAGRAGARPARYRSRHAGSGKQLLRRRMRLIEMIDLAPFDLLGSGKEFLKIARTR